MASAQAEIADKVLDDAVGGAPSPTAVRPISKLKLVADATPQTAPDLLHDDQVYAKVGGNELFLIEPTAVHFRGVDLKQRATRTVKITNTSTRSQRLHILHPKPTSPFQITFRRRLGTLAPGITQEIEVHYTPRDYKYVSGRILVHSSINFLVPIHAYPTIVKPRIPRVIELGNCPVGERVERSYYLESKTPVQFEFKISTSPCAYFRVEPRKGVIPPRGRAEFTVSYAPTRLITSQMKLRLEVSQFGFKPIESTVVGSATPLTKPGGERYPCNTIHDVMLTRKQGKRLPVHTTPARRRLLTLNRGETARFLTESEREMMTAGQVTKLQKSDHIARFTQRLPVRKPEPDSPPDEYRQTRIPDRFTQKATNFILTKKPGKRSIAEMKAAVRAQQAAEEAKQAALAKTLGAEGHDGEEQVGHNSDYSSAPSVDVEFSGESEQMRQMVFLRKLKDYTDHEQSLAINPTKGRIGQRIMSADQREAILEGWRSGARSDAADARSEARVRNKTELVRASTRVAYPRSRAEDTVTFDDVAGDAWDARAAALRQFVRAAAAIVVRRRVNRRVERLREVIGRGAEVQTSFGDAKLAFDLKFSPDTLLPKSFPSADADQEVPRTYEPKPIGNFFPVARLALREGSTYKRLGYEPLPMPPLAVYMPPNAERTLRAGAIEEHLLATPSGMDPAKQGSLDAAGARASVLGSRRELDRAVEQNALLVFAPAAEIYRDADGGEKADDEKGDNDEEGVAVEGGEGGGDEDAEAPEPRFKPAPEHLLTGSAYTPPGTKSWPYTLLRSHPSLCVHVDAAPQSEVQPGAYGLRPALVGDPDRQKFYLTERAGSAGLVSLEQLPSMTGVWQAPQTSDGIRFNFSGLVPLKHPHVDLDEEVPLQDGLDDEDRLSDSDTDDEETEYKAVAPTVELSRTMFGADAKGGADGGEGAAGRAEESFVTRTAREAQARVDVEVDEDRLTAMARLPTMIDKVNQMTKDKRLRVANFLS